MPETTASTAASAMTDHATRVQLPTTKASLAFSIGYSFGRAYVVRRTSGARLPDGAGSSRIPVRGLDHGVHGALGFQQLGDSVQGFGRAPRLFQASPGRRATESRLPA